MLLVVPVVCGVCIRPGRTGPDPDIQRSCYTRYHRAHGLSYQGVMAPNGLFCDIAGPVCGRYALSSFAQKQC